MNRKQRRTKQTQERAKEKTRILKRNEVGEVIAYTIYQYQAAVALCLQDKLGLNKEQIDDFLKKLNIMFLDIKHGHLDLDDIVQTANEELKLYENKGGE